jgi:hypothetical protein
VRTSIVEQSLMAGMFVIASQATVESTVVRNIAAEVATASFGDGLLVISPSPTQPQASVMLDHVLVDGVARAGIANFGSVVSMGNSAIRCAAFELEGEPMGAPFRFEDRANNLCGCSGDGECVAVSAALAPPVPADETMGW